jgi:hypothetical protein
MKLSLAALTVALVALLAPQAHAAPIPCTYAPVFTFGSMGLLTRYASCSFIGMFFKPAPCGVACARAVSTMRS